MWIHHSLYVGQMCVHPLPQNALYKHGYSVFLVMFSKCLWFHPKEIQTYCIFVLYQLIRSLIYIQVHNIYKPFLNYCMLIILVNRSVQFECNCITDLILNILLQSSASMYFMVLITLAHILAMMNGSVYRYKAMPI